jgi:hypothetical protein
VVLSGRDRRQGAKLFCHARFDGQARRSQQSLPGLFGGKWPPFAAPDPRATPDFFSAGENSSSSRFVL